MDRQRVPCPFCGVKNWARLELDKTSRPTFYCEACRARVFCPSQVAYGGMLVLIDERKSVKPDDAAADALETAEGNALAGIWAKRKPADVDAAKQGELDLET